MNSMTTGHWTYDVLLSLSLYLAVSGLRLCACLLQYLGDFVWEEN